MDFNGLYFDSETAPGSKMNFSTFGDGSPRLQGLPDVFDGIESAVEDWRNSPDVYAVLRSEYISLLLTAIDDAGQVMNAVANGTDTDAALAAGLPIPEGHGERSVDYLWPSATCARPIIATRWEFPF